MELSITRFFSPEEITRLEKGLPRLGEWSSQMFVPFEARQLRRARILWINRRWYLERQIDVSRADVRDRVATWLVDEFAYAVSEDGAGDAFTSRVRTLYADRYGISSGRSVHGGSGRVATIGCFQAKGIGLTPLVGTGSNRVHSSGCSSVEEGIREAIYAEIAAAEFPHGAVPVIAILDTGLSTCAPLLDGPRANNIQPVRRAIIVRPAVLRVAHAERAPLFLHSVMGYANSQMHDAQRTRDVVRRWCGEASRRSSTNAEVFALPELMTRIAEQIAFGQVHRLFNGGYFSSNLTLGGALLDYGGTRSLPNWVNARTLDGIVGFGEEMKILHKLIESVSFYFSKYQAEHCRAPSRADSLRSLAQSAYDRAFARECLRMWGVPSDQSSSHSAAVAQGLRRYFLWQQKFQVNYKHGSVCEHGWLYDHVVADPSASALTVGPELETLDAIRAALRKYFCGTPDREARLLHAWSCAVRYLMPRDLLDRERLQRSIEHRLATDLPSNASSEWIDEFVRATVGQSRRHWPRLPADLTVQAHAAYEGSSALRCVELVSGRAVYWLEGVRVNNSDRLFDTCFSTDLGKKVRHEPGDDYWTARIAINDMALSLPAMQLEYRRPSTELTGGAESLRDETTGISHLRNAAHR